LSKKRPQETAGKEHIDRNEAKYKNMDIPPETPDTMMRRPSSTNAFNTSENNINETSFLFYSQLSGGAHDAN